MNKIVKREMEKRGVDVEKAERTCRIMRERGCGYREAKRAAK